MWPNWLPHWVPPWAFWGAVYAALVVLAYCATAHSRRKGHAEGHAAAANNCAVALSRFHAAALDAYTLGTLVDWKRVSYYAQAVAKTVTRYDVTDAELDESIAEIIRKVTASGDVGKHR